MRCVAGRPVRLWSARCAFTSLSVSCLSVLEAGIWCPALYIRSPALRVAVSKCQMPCLRWHTYGTRGVAIRHRRLSHCASAPRGGSDQLAAVGLLFLGSTNCRQSPSMRCLVLNVRNAGLSATVGGRQPRRPCLYRLSAWVLFYSVCRPL